MGNIFFVSTENLREESEKLFLPQHFIVPEEQYLFPGNMFLQVSHAAKLRNLPQC